MIKDDGSVISINPPLEGEWKFLCPPGHHPNAFDFVKYSPNRTVSHNKLKVKFLFGKIASKDYFCWGEPTFSPINGQVIRASDGWEDHRFTSLWKTIAIWYNATYRFRPKEHNGQLDIRPNAGNHVMIEADDGYIAFLAHMKNGSILVKEGERVVIGDQIGRIGNSGNSTAPHLHINLFDQMDDPYKAEVLPFVFKQYEVMSKDNIWVTKHSSVPTVGDFVKFNRITSDCGVNSQ